MKFFAIAIPLSLALLVAASCKKDNNTPIFDYQRAAGIWVPYEIINESGEIVPGPFTANSIFGSYAESVHLNIDKTFIPVIWFDDANVIIKNDEAGNFEFTPPNKLSFQGLFDFEWNVTKFENEELWLTTTQAAPGDVTYKFRRQP